MRILIKPVMRFGVCIGCGLTLSSVSASDNVVSLGVSAEAFYDDNFRMEEDARDSSGVKIRPSLNWIYSTPTYTSNILFNLALTRNAEFSEYDSEDPVLSWDQSFERERLSAGLGLSYSDIGVRENADEDDGNFDSDARARTFSFSPWLKHELTELDEVGVSYGLTHRTYDDDEFNDNINHRFSISWARDFTPVLSSRLVGGVSRYESDGDTSETTTDSQSLTVGLVYEDDEHLKWNLDAGFFASQETLTRQAILGDEDVETDNTGWLASIGANYDLGVNQFNFGLGHQLFPSNDGSVDEQTRLSVGWRHSLTEYTILGSNARWIENRAPDNDDEFQSWQADVWIQHELTESLSIGVDYRRLEIDDDEGRRASNRAGLSLNYQYDLF
jgi:hypothetical protein